MLETLADIGAVNLAALAVTIFAAAVLRAFTGFGFALAALPVLGIFFAPGTSVSIVALLTLFVSLQSVKSYWGIVPVRSIAPMIALSAIGTLLGVYLLLLIDATAFQLLTGVTVMLACILLTRVSLERSETGGLKSWIAGLASGLLNGAIAIPGPPVIIYAMAVFREPEKSRAFLMTFFLFSALFAIIGFTSEGHLKSQELLLFVIALPAMIAGDRTGFMLFEKHGTAAYRKVAMAALFTIGASVTLRALFA